MPENSQFINLAGGVVTISSTSNFGGVSDVDRTIIGSAWETNSDARPALFPLWDNQGVLNIQTAGRSGHSDIIWLSADFKTSGTVNVAAGNILGLWRPLASSTSNTATVRDVWGGSWVTTGSLPVVGNAIRFASDFSSSGTGAINIGYDGEGCSWVKEANTGVYMSLESSGTPVTINGAVELHSCVSVIGDTKFTFGNVTVFDAVFRAPIEISGNMSVRRTENNEDNRIKFFSSLTINGYAKMDRGVTNYDLHAMKLGGSASIVVGASGTIDVTWIEILPQDDTNFGTASVTINGNAIFRRNSQAYDWYLPTTLAASSVSKFTGPNTNAWGGSVVIFYTGSIVAGTLDLRDRYTALFYGKINFLTTTAYLTSTTNDVAYLQHQAPSSGPIADRTLTLPAGSTVPAIDFYGNTQYVAASAVSTIQLTNVVVRTMQYQVFGPAGSIYRITNSSKFDTLGYVQLDGVAWINEGFAYLDGKMTMNTDIATKGMFINAPAGRIIATQFSSFSGRMQIINYGDFTWTGLGIQTSGIFSNNSLTINNNVIMEDAFVLLPSNRVTYVITSRTEAPYVQFNGGWWCHVQGSLHVAFNPSGWTPASGQSWSLIVTGTNDECIGQFTNITTSGLGAGLSVQATWEDDGGARFTGMKITICQTTSAGCGTSEAQTKTTLSFPTEYLSYIPAGAYSPPPGTPTVTAPTKAGTTPNPAPGTSAPSPATAVSYSFGLIAFALLALAL